MKFILSIFYFLGVAHICFSQVKEKDDEHFIVYINEKDCSIRASVCFERSDFKPKQEIVYGWYSANNILHTYGGYDGKVLDGAYTSLYFNNNLYQKGSYKKGYRDGEWMEWYKSGSVRCIRRYRKGLLKLEIGKDESGYIAYKAHYKKSSLHCKTFYKDNSSCKKEFYKLGKIIEKGRVPFRDSLNTARPIKVFPKRIRPHQVPSVANTND